VPRSRAAHVVLPVLAALALAGAGSSATSLAHNGRIAYAHVGANGDRFQIYTTTATGTHRQRLTGSRKFSSLAPAYARSGRRIVFVRAYKQSDLWTMNDDGTRKRRLTWTKKIGETAPAWSPDGTQIAFAVTSPGHQGIWLVRVDGHGRRQLTVGADTHPSWSPDGSTIAFSRSGVNFPEPQIFVVPAAGGAATDLTDDATSAYVDPAWSPDGSRILFSSDRTDPNQLDLWVMNPAGSGIARVTNTPSRSEFGPAWSPDGRKIVYSGYGSFHGASSSQLYVSRTNGTGRRTLTHACGECAIVNDDPSWQPRR
jgi:tol-pal system beta propeller repeat protein TolB